MPPTVNKYPDPDEWGGGNFPDPDEWGSNNFPDPDQWGAKSDVEKRSFFDPAISPEEFKETYYKRPMAPKDADVRYFLQNPEARPYQPGPFSEKIIGRALKETIPAIAKHTIGKLPLAYGALSDKKKEYTVNDLYADFKEWTQSEPLEVDRDRPILNTLPEFIENIGKSGSGFVLGLVEFFPTEFVPSMVATFTPSQEFAGTSSIPIMGGEMGKALGSFVRNAAKYEYYKQLKPSEFDTYRNSKEGKNFEDILFNRPFETIGPALLWAGAMGGVAKQTTGFANTMRIANEAKAFARETTRLPNVPLLEAPSLEKGIQGEGFTVRSATKPAGIKGLTRHEMRRQDLQVEARQAVTDLFNETFDIMASEEGYNYLRPKQRKGITKATWNNMTPESRMKVWGMPDEVRAPLPEMPKPKPTEGIETLKAGKTPKGEEPKPEVAKPAVGAKEKTALEKMDELAKRRDERVASGEIIVSDLVNKQSRWKQENQDFAKREAERGGFEKGEEYGYKKEITSPDLTIENAFREGAKGDGFIVRNAKRVSNAWNAIKNDFILYRELKKKFPDTHNTFRELRGRVMASRRSAQELMNDITGLLKNRKELDVFRRYVVLKDWQESLKQGIKIESNMNINQINAEVARLESIMNPRIRQSADRHFSAMRDMYRDWMDRKGRDLPDEFRQYYYPHQVLDFINQEYSEILPGVPTRLKTPFDPHLQIKRGGSTKAINKNYIKVMSDYFHKYFIDKEMDRFIDEVMNKHNDPTKVNANGIPIGGWTEYRDYGRSGYYQGYSIPERAVDMMVKDLEGKGETVGEALKPRETLMVGERPSWIVPREVALAASKLREPQGGLAGSAPIKALNKATGWWKLGIVNPIFNPRFFWLQVFSDPWNLYITKARAFGKLPKALSEITKETILKHLNLSKGSEVYKQAEYYNAINSGFFGVEVPTVQGRASLWRLMSNKEKLAEVAKTIPRVIEGLNRERENSFRFARFIYEFEKGASLSEAARMARETGPDYGNFTPFENTFLRGLLAPFYSWAKENPRFITKELYQRPGNTIGKIGGMYYATAAWNETQHSDIESQLEEKVPYIAERFHIILGKDSAGNPVIFAPQNPIDDYLEFLGYSQNEIRRDIALATGLDIPGFRVPAGLPKPSLGQFGKTRGEELLLAIKYKGINLLTPLVKEPIEQALNWDFFYESRIEPKYLSNLPSGERGTVEDRIPFTDIRITRRQKHSMQALIPATRALAKEEKMLKDTETINVLSSLGVPLRKYDFDRPTIDIPKYDKDESMRRYIDLEEEIYDKYQSAQEIPPTEQKALADALLEVTRHYRYPNGRVSFIRDKKKMIRRRIEARRLKEMPAEERIEEFAK
jgi:hypothetical protein